MKTPFFNILMDVTEHDTVLGLCKGFFSSKEVHTLFFLNAHCFNIAQKNPGYLKAINESDLLLNDGVGISLGCRIIGIRLRENLNGTDLIPEIIRLADECREKVYFLGGKKHVPGRAVNELLKTHSELLVAGYHSGYFTETEEESIIKDINDSGAGLLILGMGVPRQELWTAKHKDALPGVKLIVCGGAILDFLSREISRAPLWMRKMYVEWVYRLYLEPKRMWKRYIIGNLLFFYYVFRFMLKDRLA